MASDKSIVDLGELSKPATVLIEKVSDAIGGLAKPWQIRRVANAEADAEKIRAAAAIEISDTQRRAMRRLVEEEGKRQENIEKIAYQAAQSLDTRATPEDVDDDWITHFFDKARLISDEKMQQLWSRVLAGEATAPGSYSRRTIEWMGTMDKADAELFTKLCSYCCHIGELIPIIYDTEHQIYNSYGITFEALKHLDDIGLITFEPLSGFKRGPFFSECIVQYCGYPIGVAFPKEGENYIDTGKALFTKTGQELLRICSAPAIFGFPGYLTSKWMAKNLGVYTLLVYRNGKLVRPPPLEWGDGA